MFTNIFLADVAIPTVWLVYECVHLYIYIDFSHIKS